MFLRTNDMNRMIGISICIVVVISVQACKDEREREELEPAKPRIGMLKSADQLKVEWTRLDNMIRDEPELQREVKRLLDRYAEEQVSLVDTEALQRIYGILRDPGEEVSAARESLRLFIKMNAVGVVRESLLHKNRDVVIIAGDALIDYTKRGMKDEAALPYLIHVLAQNNYIQQGSEDATIHYNMKRKLIKAMQEITDLDLKADEVDADNIDIVNTIVAGVSDWAKKKGMKIPADK